MQSYIRLKIGIVLSILVQSFPVINLCQQNNFYLKYYHLPIKENVQSIKSFGKLKIYAVAKNFFQFASEEWKVVPLMEKGSEQKIIAGKNSEQIYLAERLYPLNYSKLVMYDGKNYQNITHPFGNEITSMDVDKEGTIWLGGDRELAKREKNTWQFVGYPPTQLSISTICAINSNQVWIRTFDGHLYLYDGLIWKRFLDKEFVKKISTIGNQNILVLTNNKLFEIKNLQPKLLVENELLKKVSSLDAEETNMIYFAGDNGLFLYHDGSEWGKIEIDYKENINSIHLTGDREGYLACDGGIIIYFSQNPSMSNIYYNYGFEPIKTIQYAKNIDDEYGVGFADLDKNGFQDIYSVCLYDPNRLQLNIGNQPKYQGNRFIERSTERKISGLDDNQIIGTNISKTQLGAGIADIENDGDEDVYVTSLIGNNKLFLNDGYGIFRDVSSQKGRGIGSGDRTNSACFSDVNNDGWIDLFLVNEYSSNRLYINKGNGYFNEVTKQCGLESAGGSNGAVFADADNDGLQDLFVCNWGKPNEFYKNVSTTSLIKFIKMSFPSNNSHQQTIKSNSAVFFDYNNDGLQDLFVTNRGFTNRLYHNLGNMKFVDVTDKLIGTDQFLSYSASAADFDNDGYLDLFVSNVGKSVLYKNINGESFFDVTDLYGVQTEGYCTGSSTADIDNDGDIDLYAACFVNGSSKLFVNKTDNQNYFLLNVEGTISNRDAIGVRVNLYDQLSNQLIASREISGGSGYASINSKQVHFGASNDKLYKIVIFFPASKRTIVLDNQRPGQFINISEEAGFLRTKTILTKKLNSLINDPENQIEAGKIFLVLWFLFLSLYQGRRKYAWRFDRNILAHIFVLFIYIAETKALFSHGFMLATIFPIISVLLGILLIHLVYQRIILRLKIKEERKRTRDSIARDLHDDLASTISSGLIYADALKRSINQGDNRQENLAQNISSLLVEASETINDLVWTVSPTHDSIQDLAARLRFFISDACENNNIVSKIDVNISEPDKIFQDEIRKNIFLIFKEAMQNVIKHSQASEVIFTIDQTSNDIKIVLGDNGIGFDKMNDNTNNILHGNGLNNLKKRGAEISAQIEIKSYPGSGTEIMLKMKMI